MIDEGKIGKVQYLYGNRLNYGKVRTEEDAFLDCTFDIQFSIHN